MKLVVLQGAYIKAKLRFPQNSNLIFDRIELDNITYAEINNLEIIIFINYYFKSSNFFRNVISKFPIKNFPRSITNNMNGYILHCDNIMPNNFPINGTYLSSKIPMEVFIEFKFINAKTQTSNFKASIYYYL